MTSDGKAVREFSAGCCWRGPQHLVRADDNGRTPISRERILGALAFLRDTDCSGTDGTTIRDDGCGTQSSAEGTQRGHDGWRVRQSSLAMRTSQCLPSVLRSGALGACRREIRDSARPVGRELVASVEAAKHAGPQREDRQCSYWTADYIHMTLPVLCLQNGGRGQQVRVISKETKKTVCGAGNRARRGDIHAAGVTGDL